MSTPSWINVKVSMQSAIGANVTISAVTKATTAVASATAHGFTNGSYVLITCQGMAQISGRIFRVANVAANTFELEGENSLTYDTFTSGTAQLITLGTSFSTLKTVNASGGEFDKVEMTTIHDTIKKTRPGMASEIVYDFDSFWDLSDAALLKSIEYSNTQAQAGFKFKFPNGAEVIFYGYVGSVGIPTGSTGEAVMSKISVSASGLPKYYTA